ncbi:MAG: oligogalacturonate lyase family protein [Rariglobus sp.]
MKTPFIRLFRRFAGFAIGAGLLLVRVTAADTAAPVAKSFTDPDTGAKIIHLSTIPNSAAGVIYFHQACITPDSRYTLVRYLDKSAGHTAGKMYRYDFKTGELVLLTDMMTKNQVLAPKSGVLYFTDVAGTAIYATNIFDLKTRKVADMPEGILCLGGVTVNADETLVVGTGGLVKDQPDTAKPLTTPPNQGPVFNDTFNRHDTNLLLAVDISTGKVTELHRINTWLGHTQFSPVDPKLLMYCHEGPWAKVDRMWTLRIGDGSEPQCVLKRTEENEIAGHEFWSTDGATVWYDHNYRNTPGKAFLEGKHLATGAITRYPIKPEIASIHYVQSPDGKFFVADGHTIKDHPEQQAMFILVPDKGELRAIKLCSMARNDYKAAEPNPHLTPDQRWVIFTATFSGVPQAYAVEMPKEYWR